MFRALLKIKEFNTLLSYACSPSSLLLNVATTGNVKGNLEFFLPEKCCKHKYTKATYFIDGNNITMTFGSLNSLREFLLPKHSCGFLLFFPFPSSMGGFGLYRNFGVLDTLLILLFRTIIDLLFTVEHLLFVQ